jgi:hypothetical protein
MSETATCGECQKRRTPKCPCGYFGYGSSDIENDDPACPAFDDRTAPEPEDVKRLVEAIRAENDVFSILSRR